MENTQKLKVVPISDKNENSRSVSVADCLKASLEYLDEEDVNPTDVLVLFLTRRDEEYNTNYFNAGLSASEAIALLEVNKIKFLGEMNYLVRPGDSS